MFAEAAGVIGLAKSSLDLVKSVQTLVKDSGKAELKEKITELSQKIADLTQQVTELALRNSELHGKLLESQQSIQQMEERLKLRGELVHRSNSYYRKAPDGSGEDGPFCTRCYDVDGTLVREYETSIMGATMYSCPNCAMLTKSRKR